MDINYRLGAIGIAVFLVIGLGLPVQALAGKADGAISRLEARADSLKREMMRPPKKGAATISRMRREVSSIRDEIARLEAGGGVDTKRLATLTGARQDLRNDPEAMTRRAEAKRQAKERKLLGGPKLGSLGREAIREDLERIDNMIAALESGREVDVAALNEYLGIVIADADRDPADRLRETEARIAALERKLVGGPKLGSLGRAKVQDEIETLTARAERLEREITR